MPERQCKQCHEWYDLMFFESTGNSGGGMHTSTWKRSICEGCSQENRDTKKQQNRWRVKMSSTRKTHAKKYEMSAIDFEQRYKWNLEQMEHDARHAYGNGCQNCSRNFASMGHGLADITLDIFDRAALPVYGINTRWICATCNRKKGARTMSDYAIKEAMWQRWENRKKNRWGGTLLAGMDVDTGIKPQMAYRRRGD